MYVALVKTDVIQHRLISLGIKYPYLSIYLFHLRSAAKLAYPLRASHKHKTHIITAQLAIYSRLHYKVF